MSRTLLKNDLILTRNDGSSVTFHIRAHIGSGASCVVYHAECDDKTEHLLKEYFPRNLNLDRADDGTIIVPEHKKEQFDQGIIRFRSGNERLKEIRLSDTLKNFTSNVQGYFYGNGTEYIDMTVFSGHTYDKVENESLYMLMLRMKILTQVIGYYHDAGFLHLDIKPDNVFVYPDGQAAEDIMLFDFDSVIEVCEKMTLSALSYTKDWAAPEQLLPYKHKNICAATDLFSIGEIIFYKIFGRHSTNAERRSFVTAHSYDYNSDIFKNVNPKVFPFLDELLCHTICSVVEKRYQSADELMAKLDEIIKIADPREPYLKSSLPAVQDFFVGRENEIEEIHQKLSEKRILFLNGIGGIGKSELAKHYALAHKKDYDAIIFAPYVSDVKLLLLNDTFIPLYNFSQNPEEKAEEYCARKLRKLQELCDDRILFIVDNLDREDDPDLNKLLDLGCKLLITTRIDFADYGYGQQLSLDALCNREKIREIFNKYYTKPLTVDENTSVEQIIDLFAGHTLTVELLAKQMKASRLKPEIMLEKLKEGGTRKSGREKVRSGKDEKMANLSTYGHIKVLFDVSELDEAEKHILINLSLIPCTGIQTEIFHDWCHLEDYEGINTLITAGWIRHDEAQDYISLHPVIADVLHEEWEKDFSVCDPLFRSIAQFLKNNTGAIRKNTEWISIIDHICLHISRTELLSDAAFVLVARTIKELLTFINPHQYAKYWGTVIDYYKNTRDRPFAASMYRIYGYLKECADLFNDAEQAYLEALNIVQTIPENVETLTANIYDSLGSLYKKMNSFDSAKEMLQKALDMRIEIYGEHHEKTAVSYNNFGTLLSEMEEYQEALKYYEKALHIWLAVPGTAKSVIAACYGNVGSTYENLRMFDKAKEYTDLATDIQRERLEVENLSTATFYNKLGLRCREKDQFVEAEEYYLKALRIRESILGEHHSSTASSYLNLSSLYREMKYFEKAERFGNKALQIFLKVYGEEHSSTANAYSHLGTLYLALGNSRKALETYEKASMICNSIYGENHTVTVQTKLNFANAYHHLAVAHLDSNRYDLAEQSLQQALEIYKRLSNEKSLSAAAVYLNLGCLYRDQSKYDSAKACLSQALEISQDINGLTHETTAAAYSALGKTYALCGDTATAGEYYKKALSIRIELYGDDHEKTRLVQNRIRELAELS